MTSETSGSGWWFACEICKRRRPDARISVHKIPFKIQGIPADRLVDYCNDSTSCATLARQVKPPEGLADRPERRGQAMKFNHAEAFCLMGYVSEDGSKRELLWNSRDGVTPFGLDLASDSLLHGGWFRMIRIPAYVPAVGQRIFVDMTAEAIRAHTIRTVGQYTNEDGSLNFEFQRAYDGLAGDALVDRMVELWHEREQPGVPDLVVVTEEMRDQLIEGIDARCDEAALKGWTR